MEKNLQTWLVVLRTPLRSIQKNSCWRNLGGRGFANAHSAEGVLLCELEPQFLTYMSDSQDSGTLSGLKSARAYLRKSHISSLGLVKWIKRLLSKHFRSSDPSWFPQLIY